MSQVRAISTTLRVARPSSIAMASSPASSASSTETGCFAPVLTYEESAAHPHMVERGTYQDVDGFRHPAPAPRFSRTPGAIQGPAPVPGSDRDEILKSWEI